MFSEKKVLRIETYFVDRRKGEFVLELAISEWGKEEGTKYGYRKLQKVCGKGTLRKEFCMCSGFSRVGLNLIREMDFIMSRLVQGWIWFLSLIKE